MTNHRDYYLARARECLLEHERLDKRAGDIKQAWARHHIKNHNWLRSHRRWWEKKLPPMTDEVAMALAHISCKSDFDYQKAAGDAGWFMNQANMYATLAGVALSDIPRQRQEESRVHSGA